MQVSAEGDKDLNAEINFIKKLDMEMNVTIIFHSTLGDDCLCPRVARISISRSLFFVNFFNPF